MFRHQVDQGFKAVEYGNVNPWLRLSTLVLQIGRVSCTSVYQFIVSTNKLGCGEDIADLIHNAGHALYICTSHGPYRKSHDNQYSMYRIVNLANNQQQLAKSQARWPQSSTRQQ